MTVTVSTPGSGLVFVNTFSAGDSAAYITCAENAEKELEAHFITPITINVTFDEANLGYSSTGTYVGAENTASGGDVNVSYAQLKAALLAHQSSPYAVSLPSTDPNPNGGADWTLPEAYARMLGLSSSAPATDLTVTLNDDDKIGWSYTDDVTSALMHELTENGMGRIGGFGENSTNTWSTMDLFAYSSPGVPDYSDGLDGRPTYFSPNGENLSSSVGLSFNQNFNKLGEEVNTGDTADFADYGDPFGIGFPGDNYKITPTDIEIMDALGWTPTQQDYYRGSGLWTNASNWEYAYGLAGYLPNSQDAGVGQKSGTVTSSSAETVNSIAVAAGGTLVIAGNSHFTATNGTVTNPDDAGVPWSGVDGAIDVDVGSTLEIGNTFDDVGTVTIGATSTGGNGDLILDGTVTLDGGGTVNLGQQTRTVDSTGSITGGGLINVNDTIYGGGEIDLTSFDNRSSGSVDVSDESSLDIVATTFTNEGILSAGSRSILELGSSSGSITNTGGIDIYSGADLAISGDVTVTGGGYIQFSQAGAEITSNGSAPASFTNDSTINVVNSGSIGDGGGAGNYLTFENAGLVFATGSGVHLTINTGANPIYNAGGTIEATNGATIAIDSNVDPGSSLSHFGLTLIPGTLEAAKGGTIVLSAGVSALGQVNIDGGAFEMSAGSSVESTSNGGVPISFTGGGGTLALDGTISTVGASGSGNTVVLTNAAVALSGGGDVIDFFGTGNAASLSGTDYALEFLQPQFGLDTINNYSPTDLLLFSQSDMGHLSISYSGANTLITLDQSDVVTLKNVHASSLTISYL